jgi:signal transduction histidine kinase
MNSQTAQGGMPSRSAFQRFAAGCVRAYHAYATWLVGISWKRFIVLSVLLMIAVGILHDMPPFTWKVSETIEELPPKRSKPAIATDKPVHYEVTIDKSGIRVRPGTGASAPGDAASSAASATASGLPSISIDLPPGTDTKDLREAAEEARQALEEAANDVREAAAEEAQGKPRTRVIVTRLGDSLPPLAFLLIILSAVLKATYKGRLQAEVKAAQATVTAEAETLKRQVVEARMAAMQAQVEPHFLFNTLASIDHLIETDPQRASLMQKNLIALLRASMPTLREADTNLGRELAVIRPYLEILKVRMEERLRTEIRVSDGLLSAEFPPMMLQSLVENAIKHGLEPKAEGGALTVAAEVVHGDLVVSVSDTGLGFGKAATAGTGVGLANIRERLLLLYGNRAQLTVIDNPGGGTTVTITVPYVSKPQPGPRG